MSLVLLLHKASQCQQMDMKAVEKNKATCYCLVIVHCALLVVTDRGSGSRSARRW